MMEEDAGRRPSEPRRSRVVSAAALVWRQARRAIGSAAYMALLLVGFGISFALYAMGFVALMWLAGTTKPEAIAAGLTAGFQVSIVVVGICAALISAPIGFAVGMVIEHASGRGAANWIAEVVIRQSGRLLLVLLGVIIGRIVGGTEGISEIGWLTAGVAMGMVAGMFAGVVFVGSFAFVVGLLAGLPIGLALSRIKGPFYEPTFASSIWERRLAFAAAMVDDKRDRPGCAEDLDGWERVFIVEDNPRSRQRLVDAFRKHGYGVASASREVALAPGTNVYDRRLCIVGRDGPTADRGANDRQLLSHLHDKFPRARLLLLAGEPSNMTSADPLVVHMGSTDVSDPESVVRAARFVLGSSPRRSPIGALIARLDPDGRGG